MRCSAICLLLVALSAAQTCPLLYQGACRPGAPQIVQAYTFNKGADASVVEDISQVLPKRDLTVTNAGNGGAFRWLSDLPADDPDFGPGVEIVNDRAQAVPRTILFSSPVDKIATSARDGNSFSVEMWIKALDLNANGPARMFSIATGTAPCPTATNPNRALEQNFQLAQDRDDLDIRFRTTDTAFATCPSRLNGVFSAVAWKHIVFTWDGISHTRRLYLDGQEQQIATVTASVGTLLTNWVSESALGIGGPVICDPACRVLEDQNNPRLCNARVRFVAFYRAALPGADVQTLFAQDPKEIVAATLTTTATQPPTTSALPPTTTGPPPSTTPVTSASSANNGGPTTSGNGGGSSTTGPAGGGPDLSCVQPGLPAAPHTFFNIVLEAEFDTFVCQSMLADITTALGVAPGLCTIYGARSGSTNLDVAVADPLALANVQELGRKVENAESTAPLTGISLVQDANGRVYVPPDSSFPWLYLVIAICVIVLLVVALIIIFACYKRHQDGKSRSYIYSASARDTGAPLMHNQYNYEMSTTSSSASMQAGRGANNVTVVNAEHDTTANMMVDDVFDTYDMAAMNAGAPPSKLYRLQLLASVVQSGQGVVQARKGEFAYADPSDYDDAVSSGSEWLWVRLDRPGSHEGYVPLSYCKRIQ